MTIHLVTAVLLTVKEFICNNSPFSAHDVTVRLREKVNNGEINCIDLPIGTIDDTETQIVSHFEIREIVAELYENKLLDCKKRYVTGDGSKNYIEYVPEVVDKAAITDSEDPDDLGMPNDDLALGSDIIKRLTPRLDVRDSFLVEKINNYVDNCHGRNILPSVKRIQGALKINGLTCKRIFDLCRNYNIGNLSVSPDGFSKSIVY